MATIEQITYEIVDLNRTTATIVVKYKTSAYPEGLLYPIDLPIQDGAAPTESALHELIMHAAPVVQLSEMEIIYEAEQKRKALVSEVNLSHIQALVVTPPENEMTTLPTTTL